MYIVTKTTACKMAGYMVCFVLNMASKQLEGYSVALTCC